MTIKEIRAMGNELVKKHLSQVAVNFTFKIINNKTSLGVCKVDRRSRQGIIGVSQYMEGLDIKHIRETILHEIAHGIDFLNTDTMTHGKSWQRVMRSLGVEPSRLASYEKTQEFIKNINYKYTLTCNNCGEVHYKSRMSRGAKYVHHNCPKAIPGEQSFITVKQNY